VKVLGTEARLLNNANCVAVYLGLVVLAINATNAVVPSPAAKNYNPTVIAKTVVS